MLLESIYAPPAPRSPRWRPAKVMTRALTTALIVCLACASFARAADSSANRPAQWAQPIVVAGVPNLHQVTPNLYRSAQPTAEGMRNLERMGIRTVINLRAFHSDSDEVADTALVTENIYMKTWHPEAEDVVRFLRIVNDPSRGPFLVHCQHGADRTGTMSAIYRITVQGWTKEQALEEMTEDGFGFHAIWQNLPPWIEALDVQQIKSAAGIKDE